MSDYKQTRDAAGKVTTQYDKMLRNLNDLTRRHQHALHKIDVLEDEIYVLKANLQYQTHLIEQLFALLDKREETDDGTVFHPNQLRSCRAADTEKLNKILAELRDPMKGQNDE
jgi:septal ring factor EnvC (AmiA/AmiB activator)